VATGGRWGTGVFVTRGSRVRVVHNLVRAERKGAGGGGERGVDRNATPVIRPPLASAFLV